MSLEKGSLAEHITEAIVERLRNTPVPLEELRSFAQALTLSYLALISHRSPDSFSAAQLDPMCAILKRGASIEALVQALNEAGVLAAELLKEHRVTVSFATVIAKMVAAQANIKAATLSA